MKPGPKADVTPDRFWTRVDKSDPDGCWLWTGCTTAAGYGRLSWGSVLSSAHRVAYMLAVGPIQPGEHILHRCDNPPCCNPAHLSAGTNRDNMLDAASKGRGPWMSRRFLTPDQADVIRTSGQGTTALARQYGVGESTVRKIRDGVTYRTVGETAPEWRRHNLAKVLDHGRGVA
jgi:hypothetical protein